jgi:predicted DNA-binding transcriptional regulator YafY
MPRRDKTERLLNLVFAMMSTNRAISRSDIRDNVAGYEDANSDEAFERMFERDKDELRSMGLPIETVTDNMGDVLGYRILPSEYEFVDLELIPEDLIVLGVAAQVWDQAVLSAPAQTALRKIEAKYGKSVVAPPAELSGLVRLQAHDVSLPILLRAAREKRVVKFNYQNRDGIQSARSIEPWAVICREGHWYCIGFDLNRNEQRTFKLPRIQGSVKLTAESHTAPRPENPSMEIPAPDGQITATVTVVPNSGAMLRRSASASEQTDDGDRLTVHGSLHDLTQWTLLALADVLRIESSVLEAAVLAASQRILDEHHAVTEVGKSHG